MLVLVLGDAVGRERSGGVWASIFFCQVRFGSFLLLCSALQFLFLDSGCLSVCLLTGASDVLAWFDLLVRTDLQP